MHEIDKNAYQILVRKYEGKRPLGVPGRIGKEIVRTDVKSAVFTAVTLRKVKF
jgi:hypothetical protein